MDPLPRWAWNTEALERQRINEAAAEINGLTESYAGLGSQIRRMLAVDEAQSTRIAKLEAVVWTLVETLVAHGSVPAAEMNERIRSAVEPFSAAEPVVGQGRGGYRSPPGAAAVRLPVTPQPRELPVVPVTCIDCGKEVPSIETLMTAEGPLCEGCHTQRVLGDQG